ncbi:DUF1995 family protein [Prochlorococcus sp. MIT 1341]|uniref:DUF1995 family protein n=1 Tax=Prochlorococcus sp. MIT 1341 TaxID=3096221 RepID=UPI002A75F665|nr:DUF1995 family protein [Prochlorococcus sp. MIT 1341]
MHEVLPKDLREAEFRLFKSSIASLGKNPLGRWIVTLKFEGLKLLPLVIRYSRELLKSHKNHYLAFPDAGATALAKREYPEMSEKIFSFNEVKTKQLVQPNILLAVMPTPPDFEIFEDIANKYSGPIVMINGNLEDSVVGIGSVARDRRKRFLSSWNVSYWLEPLKAGALMKAFPSDWILFQLTDQGYSYKSKFTDKPTSEEIYELL